MATTLGDLVTSLKMGFGGQLTTAAGDLYTDNDLAGILYWSINWMASRMTHVADTTWSDTVANIDVDTTFTPELTPESTFGVIAQAVAIWRLAESRAVITGLEDAGSYSGPGGSWNTSGIPRVNRLNAVAAKQQVDELMDAVRGFNEHGQATLDWTAIYV